MAQKPSGAANRKRKKQEEAGARAAHAARVKAGLESGRDIPKCSDPTRAHLWCVDRMTAELHAVLSAEDLDREKRWRLAAELTRAIGMLQTKADLEREVDDLRRDLEQAQDDLRAAREAAEAVRASLLTPPAAPAPQTS